MEEVSSLVIAEFTMDHPILREVLTSVSDIEVRWGMTQEQLDGLTKMTVWIESDDFEAVETALENDPGTKNPAILAELGERRLYRVDFTDLGHETDILPTVVEFGGVVQQATGTKEGWRLRIEFPNRGAIQQLDQFCRDHQIDLTFHRIFAQVERPTETNPMLTSAQRETLIEAVDSGYLSVPRECSLDRLGDRLGVSESAASERFRRGVRNLIEGTLFS